MVGETVVWFKNIRVDRSSATHPAGFAIRSDGFFETLREVSSAIDPDTPIFAQPDKQPLNPTHEKRLRTAAKTTLSRCVFDQVSCKLNHTVVSFCLCRDGNPSHFGQSR